MTRGADGVEAAPVGLGAPGEPGGGYAGPERRRTSAGSDGEGTVNTVMAR